MEDELPSGVFQRLAPGTSVSSKGFSKVSSGESVEHITCYPQIVSRLEEARQCSFQEKHCPSTRAQHNVDVFDIKPTSRLTSISRKSELFSERAPHRRQVVAYVCVPSNYTILLVRTERKNRAEIHLLDSKRDASKRDQVAS